jgi:hypothetical protein
MQSAAPAFLVGFAEEAMRCRCRYVSWASNKSIIRWDHDTFMVKNLSSLYLCGFGEVLSGMFRS